MLVVRQEDSRRNRHAQFASQRVVKKLVVGRPPERIVDHDRLVQHGVLQVRAVKRNILRNPVNDDPIAAGIGHLYAVQLHELGSYTVNLHAVDLLYHRRWKSIFHAEQNANFLHRPSSCTDVAPQRLSSHAQQRRSKPRLYGIRVKNISPPSSPTTANRVSNYRPTHPASGELPSGAASPIASHSDPDTYPSAPIPAQSAYAGSGSETSRHSCWADNPMDS